MIPVKIRAVARALAASLVPASALAQTLPTIPSTATSPWVTGVTNLANAFTGPIATALSLVAVVVGGLMFAYGEGGSKRALASLILGIGMALGSVNFIAWIT